LAETIGAGDEGAAALGLFAETMEPMAPRAARPALRWLLAKAHERLGDVSRAEADYQAAESLDPDFRPVLLDLARYASDRGDAARGLALLRRAGAGPEHPLSELLHGFAVAPPSTLGRNEPCWCGSGRKYKKCHLNREQLPLEERAAWLYQKAGAHMQQGRWLDAVVDAAMARSAFDDRPDALLHALDDPLVGDAVLFEGGAFADFIATRGGLLPDDERLLAEQWQLVERSVYEITEVRRGEGLAVRDLRTGDTHQVRERTASRQLKSGQLICARIVPAGNTMQIFGGIEPVRLNERDELIKLLDGEPDAIDLIEFLTRRFAPPAIRNTEGEPLVLCEATLRADDPAALAAALELNYRRDESAEPPLWIEEVITDGLPRVRATLILAGNELTVQANSDARFDRVLTAVRALDRTITMVKQSRTPARDAREAADLAASQPAEDQPVLDANDPELAAALDAFIRDYEHRWLDQPIPALAGHTPRQAAADPTRREDLIRLIDTLPNNPDEPGQMSPDRLRTALGLGS
jgi:tetratricopeptide (TPR) repeat protein